MAEELRAGNQKQFWEAHYLGREQEYCHMERLANLDKLPKAVRLQGIGLPG